MDLQNNLIASQLEWVLYLVEKDTYLSYTKNILASALLGRKIITLDLSDEAYTIDSSEQLLLQKFGLLESHQVIPMKTLIDDVSVEDMAGLYASLELLVDDLKSKNAEILVFPERWAGPIRLIVEQIIKEKQIDDMHVVLLQSGSVHTRQFDQKDTEKKRLSKRKYKKLYEREMKILKETYWSKQIAYIDEVVTGHNLSQLWNHFARACISAGFAFPIFAACRDQNRTAPTQYASWEEVDKGLPKEFYKTAKEQDKYMEMNMPLFFSDKDSLLNDLYESDSNARYPSIHSILIKNTAAEDLFLAHYQLLKNKDLPLQISRARQDWITRDLATLPIDIDKKMHTKEEIKVFFWASDLYRDLNKTEGKNSLADYLNRFKDLSVLPK